MNNPIIIRRIHSMLLRRADPEGKIDRSKVFEIISERVGKIHYSEREDLIKDLKDYGVIKNSQGLNFFLERQVA